MPTRWVHPLTVLWTLCLITGLVLLGDFGYGMWRGVSDQQHLNHVWQTQVAEHPIGQRVPMAKIVDPKLKRPVDGVDFAMRIPKLGYFAAIKEGTDTGVLYASPGHYTSTMWPGDVGTVGVAAHNVYWINFPQLTRGDEIDLETRYGLYRYRVMDTEVVNPDNRTALIPHADGYYLTLTTCWPLWAGAFAKQRFIIHAYQVWPVQIAPGYT